MFMLFQVITTYSNFGSALFGKDQLEKALEFFRKSQKIEEKIYGLDHINRKIKICIDVILLTIILFHLQSIQVTGSLKNIAVIY